MDAGTLLTLDIEKPAGGGRMLSRHDGRVILVAGAIPGERVAARIERVAKGVAFAQTVDVLSPSPDRRVPEGDPKCGGDVLSHIDYAAQLRIKTEIVRDAFSRIARLPLTDVPVIVPSATHGYRLRARFHVDGSRIGFYREGSHQICDAGATRQLSGGAVEWIASASQLLRDGALNGLAAVELTENVAADERACHLEFHRGADARAFVPLAKGLSGLSARAADSGEIVLLGGAAFVTDVLRPGAEASSARVVLRRDVRSFFQGNRFLVEPLLRHVLAAVPDGPVVDLYAGVGLFGLCLAVRGHAVTLVEGDPVSGADLQWNAREAAPHVRVENRSVESFVPSRRFARLAQGATVVVDPPRTGLSPVALDGLTFVAPPRIVYVSCDPATLARDTRRIVDAGYGLTGLTLFDMFPNTAHIESVAAFDRVRTMQSD
jgi:23S rRNA (uracil1939-C5)-methyltransferase